MLKLLVALILVLVGIKATPLRIGSKIQATSQDDQPAWSPFGPRLNFGPLKTKGVGFPHAGFNKEVIARKFKLPT